MAKSDEAFRSLIVFDPLWVGGELPLPDQHLTGRRVPATRQREPRCAKRVDRPYCRLAVWSVTLCAGMAILGGCKSTVTEVRGKTSFGPEFRNRGNNTHETRYDVRQNIDLKWDNGWSTGVTYRRRDVDEGSGDSENLLLFDVGYPIWKAPKKSDKTAARIGELEQQVQDIRARLAAQSTGEPVERLAHVDDVSAHVPRE